MTGNVPAMRKSIAAALVICLGLAPAAAQQLPQTIPDHSVIGRIGSGSSSGPIQAIPFATLTPFLTGAAITLNSGNGQTAPGAMSGGNTYSFGANTDTPRFAGVGLGGAAPATGGEVYNAAVAPGSNGQGVWGASSTNGGVYGGQGSLYDSALINKSGAVALGVPTGTQNLVIGGGVTAASLQTSGTIGGSLCMTAGGVMLYTSGANCFAVSGVVIASGKTLTVNNTITLQGTDGTTFTFPSTSDTIATLGQTQTFTGNKTFSGTVNFTGTPQVNGTALGTFATQNYATPPAIGGTTPAAGSFTTLSATTPIAVSSGGTNASTAAGARASSGLNIDQLTSHGDSNYTILSTDRNVGTSTTLTTARTWTLPAASSLNAGQHLVVQDFVGAVSNTNTLTIARAGSDTLNGSSTSVVINNAGGGYLLISNGVSNWSAQALGAQAAAGVSSVNSQTGAVNVIGGAGIGVSTAGGNITVSGASIANGHLIANGTGSTATAQDTAPSTWFDQAFCNTVGWLVARTTSGWVCSQGIPANIEWFGVLASNSGTTNQTNLQNLVTTLAAAGGGQMFAPNSGYKITGTITLTGNVGITCAYRGTVNVSANFIEQTTSSDLIHVHTGYNLIDNCSFQMSGSPTGTATGISYGDDAVQITTGNTFTATNTTLACSSCTFTSNDVGKTLDAVGAGTSGGPLFTSIASFTDSTHVVLSNAPGTTVSNTTFGYGFNYQENVIRDSVVYNFITDINVVAATQYHIKHVYGVGTNPLILQNIIWADSGDGSVSDSTFLASVAGSFNTVNITSGGGLRFNDNKVLAQAAITNCIQVNWLGPVSSVGPWIIGNSIEGPCNAGISVDGSATGSAHGGQIIGNEIGIASAGQEIDLRPTTAHKNWIVNSNLVRQTGGGSAIIVGNMTNITMQGNSGENTDGNGGGLFYNIQSSASGIVGVTATDIANPVTNASTSMVIDDPVGLAFASLPSSAANGSRIFVSNGAPGSSPCTGSSTGSTAFRQNGAWKCF